MRKFKCIGLVETAVEIWAFDFEIGSIYDSRDDDLCDEDIICVKDDAGVWLYVDADQFKEVVNTKQEKDG